MTYFVYAYKGLEKAGAPQADLDRYEEMHADLSWSHPSIGGRLSRKEQRKVLTERQAVKRMEKFDDLESMRTAYEVRCVTLHEHLYEYVAAVERRLEIAAGEPYVDLKNTCVMISTEWLTLTGLYKGKIGPSVKPVPKGGFPPIDFGSGDRYKISIPVGDEVFFDTVEIPPPPEAHLELLAMEPGEQALRLAEPWVEVGKTCEQPHNPFFRGLDERGWAYWAVVCEDGGAFATRISDEHGIDTFYDCNSPPEYKEPECFEPCSRYHCYGVKLRITGTDEYVPYAAPIRVEKAPPGACPDEFLGGFVTQNRGDLPALPTGENHQPSMTITDATACEARDELERRTLEIYATRHLDMLKIDLSTLEVPPMRLDRSSGPPCELLHINANIDQFADLRCRLSGDPDEILKSGPMLSVRGSFRNGESFEGKVEVCANPGD